MPTYLNHRKQTSVLIYDLLAYCSPCRNFAIHKILPLPRALKNGLILNGSVPCTTHAISLIARRGWDSMMPTKPFLAGHWRAGEKPREQDCWVLWLETGMPNIQYTPFALRIGPLLSKNILKEIISQAYYANMSPWVLHIGPFQPYENLKGPQPH